MAAPEATSLDVQLTELEEKIDRVRALYEQYFMGIERLEPLIPRKDIERRILGLRKEQMRNTAVRFKFNTLCQRFSTMQHHWGRIVREIENGTYKRDVARAAARFGADEAMTAVGRKRAAGLQKVLENQKKDEVRKEEERRQAESVAPPRRGADDEEDAPTPPPMGRAHRPPMHSYDHGKFAAPSADDAVAERAGYGPPPAAARGAPDPSAMGFPDVDVPPAPSPQRAAPEPAAAPRPAGAPAAAPPEPGKKAPAGLRLGALGVRRVADPDAARKRLEELAAKMDGASGASAPEAATPLPAAAAVAAAQAAKPQAAAPAAAAPAARTRRFDPDEVMNVAGPALAPTDPSTDSARRPMAPPAASSPGAPARPIGLRPPGAGRSSSPGEASPAPPAASAASTPTGPSAADRAAAKRSEVAAQGGRADLAEPRVREIYKEFIDAKRRSNESTASITYDKLADSLRQQVDKLKTQHKDRRIDFAVVTKDGKTMIKPIIK